MPKLSLKRPTAQEGFQLQAGLFQSFQYPSAVNGIALSESGGEIAVAAEARVEVYCTITKALLYHTESLARVKSVAMSPDGRRVLFGGWGQAVNMMHMYDLPARPFYYFNLA